MFHVAALQAEGRQLGRPRYRTVKPGRSAKKMRFFATVEVAA